jgi:hypothetical protein
MSPEGDDAVDAPGVEDQRDAVITQLHAIRSEVNELAAPMGATAVAFDALSSALVAVAALKQPAVGDEGADAEIRRSGLQVVTALEAAKAQLEAAADVIGVVEAEIIDPMLHEGGNVSVETATAAMVAAFGLSAPGPSVKVIIRNLKAALAAVWHLLSRLLRPKEWKVYGEIAGGIPGLGLAAAGIEITFG